MTGQTVHPPQLGLAELERQLDPHVDDVDQLALRQHVAALTRPLEGETDLSIPRASFADHPSTEFHFFARGEDATANKPKLTVFYLGVPDTTPEFARAGEAEAYFDRLLRAQK